MDKVEKYGPDPGPPEISFELNQDEYRVIAEAIGQRLTSMLENSRVVMTRDDSELMGRLATLLIDLTKLRSNVANSKYTLLADRFSTTLMLESLLGLPEQDESTAENTTREAMIGQFANTLISLELPRLNTGPVDKDTPLSASESEAFASIAQQIEDTVVIDPEVDRAISEVIGVIGEATHFVNFAELVAIVTGPQEMDNGDNEAQTDEVVNLLQSRYEISPANVKRRLINGFGNDLKRVGLFERVFGRPPVEKIIMKHLFGK